MNWAKMCLRLICISMLMTRLFIVLVRSVASLQKAFDVVKHTLMKLNADKTKLIRPN